MKRLLTLVAGFLLQAFAGVHTAQSEVLIVVEDQGGSALLRYECTAGELVRAFALDVTVDRGRIIEISEFFRGISTSSANGYGIFPASFRDNVAVTSATNANWEVATYTPVANPNDDPDTQAGLNSPGVTLELAALWDPSILESAPSRRGTLCKLKLTEPARVSVAPNRVRGGVVSAFGDPLAVSYAGVIVGPSIISARYEDDMITISFKGGTLEAAESPGGQWTDTGESSGTYSELIDPGASRFFRVRGTAP